MNVLRTKRAQAAALAGVVGLLGVVGSIVGPAGADANGAVIKVDGTPADSSKGNEAHVACDGDFGVNLWNFDGKRVTLTAETVAPSPGSPGIDLATSRVVVGSPDKWSGYTTEMFALQGGPQPKHPQGTHVRLTATATDGTTDNKVIWVGACAAPVDPFPYGGG